MIIWSSPVATSSCLFSAISTPNAVVSRHLEIRKKCALAVIEVDYGEALRRSLECRPRVIPARNISDIVCFWRKGKGQGLKKGGRAGSSRAGWYGPGVVIGEDDGNYWLSTADSV